MQKFIARFLLPVHRTDICLKSRSFIQMRTRIKHVLSRILDFIELNSQYDTFDAPAILNAASGYGVFVIRHTKK